MREKSVDVEGVLLEPQAEPDGPFVVIKEKRVDEDRERIGSLVELAYIRNLLLNLRDDQRAICNHLGVERDVVEVPRAAVPEHLRLEEIRVSRDATLAQVEAAVITERLKRYHANRTHCAKSLGISLRSLQDRMKRFKIDVPIEHKGRPSFDARLAAAYHA